MEKFIPYEKLSKKEKRKIDQAKRQTWGKINPVTRKPENSKAYNRRKTQDWKRKLPPDPVFLLLDFLGIAQYNTPRILVLPPGSDTKSIRLHIVRS